MDKLHPKKRLLQQYSEERCSKGMTLRPIQTTGCRLDLCDPSVQLSDISSTSKHYETYFVERDIEKSRETNPYEIPPTAETNYCIPHLPEIIVSADLLALKRVTHDELLPLTTFKSRTNQVSFSTPQMGTNLKVSTSNCLEQHSSCSPQSQKEIQCPPKSTKSKNAVLESKSTRRKSERTKKPIIPKHMEPLLYSFGIDEQLASAVLVKSGIESFRKIKDEVACNDLNMEKNLKKIRQAAKNRKSAGESRQRKLCYLKELRKTKEQLKKELDCIKSVSKRLEDLRTRYKRYHEALKRSSEWQHKEEKRADDLTIRTIIF